VIQEQGLADWAKTRDGQPPCSGFSIVSPALPTDDACMRSLTRPMLSVVRLAGESQLGLPVNLDSGRVRTRALF
jgi:hypothetical protein